MKSLLEMVKYLYIYPTDPIIALGILFKILLPSQGDSPLVIFTLKSDYIILKYR